VHPGSEPAVAGAGFLSGGGAMGALLRAHDWSASPLGAPAAWAQPLKTVVGMMLAARQPMCLVWGPARTLLCNDGYAEAIAGSQPAPGRAVLDRADIDSAVATLVERAYGGDAAHSDELAEAPFAFSCTPVRDEADRVAGALCVFAAGCRSGEGPGDADARYRQIVESAEDFAIVGLDPDGIVTAWNRGAERIVGYTAREAIGRPGAVMFTPEDRAAGVPEREMARARAVGRAVNERWQQRKDGGRFWSSGFLTRLDEGTGYAKIFRDRTAQQEAEAALRESEARFRLMADAVPQIIWITDRHGHMEFLNRQFADYTGAAGQSWAPAEMAANFIDPADGPQVVAAWTVALESGEPFDVEHRIRSAAGDNRWFLARAEPYRDPETGDIVRWFGISVDIHDRKMAEAALRESEARYRTLFETIDEGFCVVEFIDGPRGPLSDYLHLEANPAYLRHAGIADIVGKTGRAGLTESEADAWVAIFRGVLETGTPVRFERALEATDRYLEVACSRVEPAARRQVAIVFQDVSARKRAERGLRELNETLESQVAERTAERDRMWDISPDLMLVIDFGGRFRRVNPAWTALLGYAPGELVGHHVNEFVLAADHAATADAYQTAAAGGRPVIENRYRHRDGSTRWIAWAAAPAGDMTYATGRDITAEKEREAELAARNAERDRLWQLSQDMLARADYAGGMSAVSPAWTRVLGWSEAELLTRSYASFMHPDDMPPTVHAIARMAETRQPTRFENRIATRDGGWKHIEWTVTPELDGENFVAVGRDLSLNKAREGELEQAREALRQSQKMEAVGQLTGGLAHDFNNLLASISGGLQVLKLKLQRGQYSGLERYIEIGESSVRRAASLTQRLLAFSRRQTLDPKPTDVNRLIAGMEDLVRRSVGPTVELEVVNADDLWPTRVDPSQLENALLNLCINARDAMMPGGGRLTLTTANKQVGEEGAEQDLPAGEYITLCVADTGSGMPPEVVARIFDPFYTTKPLGEGTGLGLSMVYGFVRQSDGQVHVHSEVGVGTTMCLYLPRHAGAAQAEAQSQAGAAAIASGHGETVVLIEDERALRDIIEEILGDAGYRVLMAHDGPGGLQILDSDARVDLLVTDVGLPGGLNGRQVADAARLRRPDLKVLFITGYADTAVVGNGRLDPGMEVMTKPFEIGALANKVRALLDGPLPRA
jgi:PAS domain S-box-containing protein